MARQIDIAPGFPGNPLKPEDHRAPFSGLPRFREATGGRGQGP